VGALATYRGLLGNRALVRLLVGEFVSGIGDWLYLVALLVIVYRESTDPLLLGIVGGARIIPYIVLSVPAGIVADRFDRRIILLITDVARGLIMVALTLVVMVDGPLIAIVLLAILATCFSAFFNPTMGAYLPMLARDERELGPANSAFATLGEISFIIGPALAGILIAVAGLELAFAINAVTFAIIAIALLGLPSGKPGTQPMAGAAAAAAAGAVAASDTTPEAGGPATAETSDATATTTADPAAADAGPAAHPTTPSAPTIRDILRPVAGLVSLDLVSGFMFGGISVLTVLLAVDRLGAGEEATGFLNAAIGVGGVLGAVGSGAIVLRPNLGPPLLLGAGILGAGFIILGAVDVLSLSLVAMVVVSGGALLSGVVSTTVFQRVVPDAIRGRTLGVMETIGTIAYAAGAFLLPTLVTQVGYLEVLGVGGVLIIISAVIAFVLLGPSLRRATDPATEVLRRVSRLPLFAGVPPSALEAAAARLDPLDVAAGTVVIRQGDPADRFFLIESGSFAVDQADPATGEVRRLRIMGPDEVFGELGLMHQAPRSATVTAVDDGRLLVLDGPEFMELLSAGAALSGLLLERYGTNPGSTS
jgi:MFS family permease